MSITAETAKHHAKDPAVLCCRAEEGLVIGPENLEDPAIFDELCESGLLNLDGCVTIGQALGARLTKTCDALTALTASVLENLGTQKADAPASAAPAAPAAPTAEVESGMLTIRIGEGKDIDIRIPMGAFGGVSLPEPPQEPRLVRTLTRRHFPVTQVLRGPETKLEGTTLYIREGIERECVDSQELVCALTLDVITPETYHTYSDTILDVQPIATKEGDALVGTGVTRVLDGVVMMVTGTDERGVQIGEFGSSEGYLDENIMWNRPGAPDRGDLFIRTRVTIKAGTNMERPGPLAAHTATDHITQEIREALKKADASLAAGEETFEQYRRPGCKKVVIVKEIMGQGAMHDNLLLPVEPVGVLGAKPNVDLGNVPVTVSPLELLDGCIHALTCIGPASKEMSRHYWREPLVLAALNDPELDLCGVVLVGSPQINAEKFYVSRRVGQLCEMLDADGAFVTTEGFGNNHIDFASHIEQIGMRGISVVGMSFCAAQGALVVGNPYMTHMVDLNKSASGIENEVLACNTLCREDALRAIQLLKNAMGGEEVLPAERKWDAAVKAGNIKAMGGMDTVPNEQSLPMSQKRREKYD